MCNSIARSDQLWLKWSIIPIADAYEHGGADVGHRITGAVSMRIYLRRIFAGADLSRTPHHKRGATRPKHHGQNTLAWIDCTGPCGGTGRHGRLPQLGAKQGK